MTLASYNRFMDKLYSTIKLQLCVIAEKGGIMKNYSDIKNVSEIAYKFMCEFNPETCPDGRYDLEKGVFVNISTYNTKLRSEATYEAHREYIDIQFIIEGDEIIAVESLEAMHAHKCLQAFAPGSDIELYEENDLGKDYHLTNGDYLILPPEAAHMPGVCVEKPGRVRKGVIKVPVK